MSEKLEVVGPSGTFVIAPEDLEYWRHRGYVPVEQAETLSTGTFRIDWTTEAFNLRDLN